MAKIAWHQLYAHPLPEGHRFPMIKYELIPEQLLHEGLIRPDDLFSPEPLEEELVLLTHDQVYWEQLRDLRLSAKDQRRIGFPLNAQLLERELGGRFLPAERSGDCCKLFAEQRFGQPDLNY
jgi:acetoin utilization deacetylase AcuC-like enzyme